MPEDNLADIRQEGQPLASLEEAPEDKEQEVPSPSPSENTPTEETPSPEGDKPGSTEPDNTQDDKNIPFHEHPRWKQREEEWDKRFKALQTDYEEKLRNALTESQLKEQPVSIPTWFSRIYGNDPEAWHEYESWHQAEKEQIKSAAIKEYEAKQAQETEKVTKANQYIESQITALQAEGKQFDRNELLKVVNDFRPVTLEGNWDLRRAYDILEMQKASQKNPASSSARKAVASATTSDSKPEATTEKVQTNITLRGKGWNDL